MHPIIRDEVYRIGREAVVNALRRTHAKRIEVEVEYKARQLRIVIRDDGCGMDMPMPVSKRDGYRGLRKQAEAFGARLRMRSQPGAGTIMAVFC